MGSQDDDPAKPGYDNDRLEREGPIHQVTLTEFVIDRYPVIVQDYRKFVEKREEGYLNERFWNPDGWACH